MINPLDCTGKTYLVTGASSGIGRDISILLSQLGAHVVLTGRDITRLKQTHALLNGEGHIVEPFDLSDVEGILSWIKDLALRVGGLSGLVHSAGMQIISPIRVASVTQYESLMRINVTSAFSLAKGFRQKGVFIAPASIVFLSSVMGIVGQPGQVMYSTSKGALLSLTKSLALELAKEGIRVNCLAPAIVKTEMGQRLLQKLTPEQQVAVEQMHPLGFGECRDVAYAAAFLMAETGRWITGTTLVVDGGYTAQ